MNYQKILIEIRRVNGAPFVSLTDPDTNADVFKGLVTDGLLLVEKRREKRLSKLVSCCFVFTLIIILMIGSSAKLESLV